MLKISPKSCEWDIGRGCVQINERNDIFKNDWKDEWGEKSWISVKRERILGNIHDLSDLWELRTKMLFYCFLGEIGDNLPSKAKIGLKMRFLWWLCNLFDVLRFKSDVIQFFDLDHGYWIMKNEESNHWFIVLLYSSAKIKKNQVWGCNQTHFWRNYMLNNKTTP